jgi:hypothetical protein
MGPHELAHHLGRAGDSEVDMVNRLVHDLAWSSSPSIKVPRIRRFTVELVIGMLGMDSSSAFAELMAAAGMGGELRRVAETMSELECFHVFSVSAGVSRHAVNLCAFVGTTLAHMGMYACGQYPSYVHLCFSLCIYECQLRGIVCKCIVYMILWFVNIHKD